MSTDEDLMLAHQRGSADAFEELFRRYRQPVWAYFRRRVPEAGRAEELAQEVFVAVLEGARRYAPLAPVRAYLFGIAFNVLSAERRRTRQTSASLSGDVTAGRTPPSDARLWIRQALDRLEASDREIVMLREFEQLSYAEIALLLGLPINTVRSRLFRARMELRRLLDPCLEARS